VNFKIAILVAIVPQALALSLLDICREAGLETIGLTIVPVALWNLIQRNRPRRSDLSVHIDIGSESTQMLFFHEGQLQFTREVLTGGRAITQALTGSVVSAATRLDLDESQAEKLKRECGIPGEDEPKSITYQGKEIPALHIAAMIRPALERLLTDIHRSFDYYHEQFGVHKRDYNQ
jgi:cell division ATPase FtsA